MEASLRWRILDALSGGSATPKDLACELDDLTCAISQELEILHADGYVTRKPYVRYRRSMFMYELAKTKRRA